MAKIAVLGWGSLIWDTRDMKVRERWHYDGPLLPVEFARISRGNGSERLTLVLFDGAKRVPVLWIMADHSNLDAAIANLSEREGCAQESIGFVNLSSGEGRCKAVPSVIEPIEEWGRKRSLDAVIWTDLESNFFEETGQLLTEYNVINYLKKQKADGNKKVRDYIQKAPAQIKTQLRQAIASKIGWKHK